MNTTLIESAWQHLNSDLRRFLRRRVRDEHIAEDLLQETFLRIQRGFASLQDAERLNAWVYQIARNVLADHHRQNHKDPEPLADDVRQPGDGLGEVRERGAEWMNELIGELPEGYREAVQMAEIEGLTQQEVADRLGLSLSGAKSRVQRGRTLLKEVLGRCCVFHLDRRGGIVDVDPRPDRTVCLDCGEGSQGGCGGK